ncbi:SH3 domain-containing protein [Vibrio parahaemolyticus]|nr:MULTISPECIES: SH3 domain-containing protein [Vibrio]MDW1982097.1 SH3 domain-containing protein [Vibrio sp. Vb0304]
MSKMRSRGQTQDLFDKVKEHLDSNNLQLDFNIRHEIEVKVFQQNDLDSLSDKAIRALFKILEIIVLPFILSCLATLYMEQSDKIRTVFQGLTSTKEVKHEIRNNTFDNSFQNYRIVIATKLNLREHPTTKSAVMGTLPLGDVLETLDAEDRHWLYVRVELDGEIVTGWVYRRYTKRLKTHGSAR